MWPLLTLAQLPAPSARVYPPVCDYFLDIKAPSQTYWYTYLYGVEVTTPNHASASLLGRLVAWLSPSLPHPAVADDACVLLSPPSAAQTHWLPFLLVAIAILAIGTYILAFLLPAKSTVVSIADRIVQALHGHVQAVRNHGQSAAERCFGPKSGPNDAIHSALDQDTWLRRFTSIRMLPRVIVPAAVTPVVTAAAPRIVLPSGPPPTISHNPDWHEWFQYGVRKALTWHMSAPRAASVRIPYDVSKNPDWHDWFKPAPPAPAPHDIPLPPSPIAPRDDGRKVALKVRANRRRSNSVGDAPICSGSAKLKVRHVRSHSAAATPSSSDCAALERAVRLVMDASHERPELVAAEVSTCTVQEVLPGAEEVGAVLNDDSYVFNYEQLVLELACGTPLPDDADDHFPSPLPPVPAPHNPLSQEIDRAASPGTDSSPPTPWSSASRAFSSPPTSSEELEPYPSNSARAVRGDDELEGWGELEADALETPQKRKTRRAGRKITRRRRNNPDP